MKNYLIFALILLLFVAGLLFELYKIKPVEHIERTIKVYIVGEVAKPGVYEVDEEGRIEDVIQLAGGLTAMADTDAINLASRLMDGEKIVIKGIGKETNAVDIYSLTKKDWIAVDGIGDKKAALIMDYLADNKTATITDFINIKGISKNNVESIIKHFNGEWIYVTINFGGNHE